MIRYRQVWPFQHSHVIVVASVCSSWCNSVHSMCWWSICIYINLLMCIISIFVLPAPALSQRKSLIYNMRLPIMKGLKCAASSGWILCENLAKFHIVGGWWNPVGFSGTEWNFRPYVQLRFLGILRIQSAGKLWDFYLRRCSFRNWGDWKKINKCGCEVFSRHWRYGSLAILPKWKMELTTSLTIEGWGFSYLMWIRFQIDTTSLIDI